ncbi:hypothetical protein V8G54_036714 [Vigna mungo]|uniref:Uncharacterized protein n=1 Tax=Vigna mungo TaxID=3915 RepID=A0AAQ3MHW3_VIGMU
MRDLVGEHVSHVRVTRLLIVDDLNGGDELVESSDKGGGEFTSGVSRPSYLETIEWESGSEAQSPTIYSEKDISRTTISLHVGMGKFLPIVCRSFVAIGGQLTRSIITRHVSSLRRIWNDGPTGHALSGVLLSSLLRPGNNSNSSRFPSLLQRTSACKTRMSVPDFYRPPSIYLAASLSNDSLSASLMRILTSWRSTSCSFLPPERTPSLLRGRRPWETRSQRLGTPSRPCLPTLVVDMEQLSNTVAAMAVPPLEKKRSHKEGERSSSKRSRHEGNAPTKLSGDYTELEGAKEVQAELAEERKASMELHARLKALTATHELDEARRKRKEALEKARLTQIKGDRMIKEYKRLKGTKDEAELTIQNKAFVTKMSKAEEEIKASKESVMTPKSHYLKPLKIQQNSI